MLLIFSRLGQKSVLLQYFTRLTAKDTDVLCEVPSAHIRHYCIDLPFEIISSWGINFVHYLTGESRGLELPVWLD